MKSPILLKVSAGLLLAGAAGWAQADTVGCITTAWKLLGANHRVCVQAFGDPKVPGVTCHVSQARTGGISGALTAAASLGVAAGLSEGL